jgi:hypothetical protein
MLMFVPSHAQASAIALQVTPGDSKQEPTAEHPADSRKPQICPLLQSPLVEQVPASVPAPLLDPEPPLDPELADPPLEVEPPDEPPPDEPPLDAEPLPELDPEASSVSVGVGIGAVLMPEQPAPQSAVQTVTHETKAAEIHFMACAPGGESTRYPLDDSSRRRSSKRGRRRSCCTAG